MDCYQADRFIDAILKVIDTRAAANYSKDSELRAEQYRKARKELVEILIDEPFDSFGL